MCNAADAGRSFYIYHFPKCTFPDTSGIYLEVAQHLIHGKYYFYISQRLRSHLFVLFLHKVFKVLILSRFNRIKNKSGERQKKIWLRTCNDAPDLWACLLIVYDVIHYWKLDFSLSFPRETQSAAAYTQHRACVGNLLCSCAMSKLLLVYRESGAFFVWREPTLAMEHACVTARIQAHTIIWERMKVDAKKKCKK